MSPAVEEEIIRPDNPYKDFLKLQTREKILTETKHKYEQLDHDFLVLMFKALYRFYYITTHKARVHF